MAKDGTTTMARTPRSVKSSDSKPIRQEVPEKTRGTSKVKSSKSRAREIIRRLQAEYPTAHCSLEYSSPLELLVATILSAQCTDERVNLVTPTLFRKFRTAADYAEAELSELEMDIRSTGFFRNKARHLQGMGQRLVEAFDGKVPKTMAELLTLPGVARKTANVVLGNAFGKAPGVVVDTHVTRLSTRLRLTSEATPEKIERDLMALIPKKHWVMFPHWLIFHGRAVCKARSPQCQVCVLADLCPSVQKPDGQKDKKD
ncbi:MAG TPA: endonuclease III [Acidobacteriota bacterium]|nr:endonuclease III [Acidobacteriota bacterium]